ncbi:cadherin EGF LAG seven-pass G-type receptor 1-like isoform X2 [Acanthaster planci]|uniref:Cadherin EGF LAG seven-pass G-type receptor 1-like isoform X2 n=1 Tax=Acanthaster planci TaxID=133434 RepID=A0A8B7ZA24_ACAPL|nr:cadherin EGF LAG seven-pass G-type receptor 1-like isoform X2 [Acanthaster planci]
MFPLAMTSRKSQPFICLIFLAAYLYLAPAHYVPCYQTPCQTLATKHPTVTNVESEGKKQTSTDVTSHGDLSLTTMTGSASLIDTTGRIEADEVEDTARIHHTTADAINTDTSISINNLTDFDVAIVTNTTDDLKHTAAIDRTTSIINDFSQKNESMSRLTTDTPDNFDRATSWESSKTVTDNQNGLIVTTSSVADTFKQLNTPERIGTVSSVTPTIRADVLSSAYFDTTSPPFTSASAHKIQQPSLTPSSPLENLYSPVFYEDIYYADVSEHAPVGTVLLMVQALDWDDGGAGEITYNISNGAEDMGGLTDFAVHPVTGVVAVVGDLDREAKGVYMINLTATDQGKPARSAEAQLQITLLDVNDNAPVFVTNRYEIVVDENTYVMSRVLRVIATDNDIGTNGVVTYRLSGDYRNTFSIGERSGLIRTQRSLDRERVASYNFQVIASDQGTPTLQTSVEVMVLVGDVNDNPPKFPSTTFHLNVTENNLPFGLIGKVTATDADEGPNAVVTYAFVQQRAPQRYFQIERSTGIVHALYSFDREERSEYQAVIRAFSGKLFTDVHLVVHIHDINDNSPTVPSTQGIFYSFYAGYDGCNAIGKVGALDKDSGDSLIFRLVERDKSAAGVKERRKTPMNVSERNSVHVLGMNFTLDANTGMIHACHQPAQLDRIPSTVQLRIEVSDGLHSNICSSIIYPSPVTDLSLSHCMLLRLRIRSDIQTFLSRYREFVSAVARVFRTTGELVTLVIRGGFARPSNGVANPPEPLRALLAVRRRDKSVVPPNELRSLVYLESEQLQVFADILPDPVRPQCRLVPTMHAGGASIVSEVALGLSYTAFNVSFRANCEAAGRSYNCGVETCSIYEECISQGENRRQAPEYSCRCLFVGTTNCQPPFATMNCSEAVCNHRGSCVVDDAGEVNCFCRDQGRYDGPRCQMTTRTFKEGSYQAHMPLGRVLREFHISLRFKTVRPNGLLLYNGQLGGRGESVALQILGGILHFRRSGRADAGSGGTSASVARNVSDGAWHDVYINHSGGVPEPQWATFSRGHSIVRERWPRDLGPFHRLSQHGPIQLGHNRPLK